MPRYSARWLAVALEQYFALPLAAAGLTQQQLLPAAEHARAGDMDKAVELVDDGTLTLGVAGSPEHVVERCRGLTALHRPQSVAGNHLVQHGNGV